MITVPDDIGPNSRTRALTHNTQKTKLHPYLEPAFLATRTCFPRLVPCPPHSPHTTKNVIEIEGTTFDRT